MANGYRPAQEYTNTMFMAAVAAGTATREDPIFRAPCRCRPRQVSVTPQAGSTGDNTNRKDLNIKNKGAAGAGTTIIGGVDLVTGVNLVAFDERVIPLTSNPILETGDVLTLETEQNGTGVAVGPFVVAVDWEPV
jgi:hypothetical protein